MLNDILNWLFGFGDCRLVCCDCGRSSESVDHAVMHLGVAQHKALFIVSRLGPFERVTHIVYPPKEG